MDKYVVNSTVVCFCVFQQVWQLWEKPKLQEEMFTSNNSIYKYSYDYNKSKDQLINSWAEYI